MKIGNPVSSYFAQGRSAKRKQDEADRHRKTNIATARTMGTKESERYLTGTVSEAQKKNLDETDTAKEAILEPMTMSTEDREHQLNEYRLDRKIHEAAMQEATWNKAIQSLGYSASESAKMIAEFRQNQRETQQAYMNLMGTIAVVGAGMLTGGTGAVVAATALAGAKGASKGASSSSSSAPRE